MRVKFVDCTEQPDGRCMLDGLPGQVRDIFYLLSGGFFALLWGVLVPAKLF